jgi:hypothetical protein
MMDTQRVVDVVVIDEVQLLTDPTAAGRGARRWSARRRSASS